MLADKNNQLELISELLDALMVQLGQLKDNPTTEGELIQQIIRLAALYRAIRTGDDLFVQAR
jgi:uncharacterized protein (UPF0305 family)